MTIENGSGALREALIKLSNEASGMLGLSGVREAIGNTNMACLQLRVDEARALLSLSSPTWPPSICGVIGYPEQGKQVCELLAGHEGYHRQKDVRWLGAWKPWDTTPESPTPQASSEIREGAEQLLNEFIGYISVEYEWRQERWEHCQKLAKSFLTALAPSRQGAGGK